MPHTQSRKIEVVTVPSQLIVGNREEFKADVRRLIMADRDIVLDFANVEYIDSSGLGVTVTLSKLARDHGQKLVVCGLNDDLTTLFELTKLDTMFTMHPDVTAAVTALAR